MRSSYDVKPMPGVSENMGLLMAILEEGTWEWRTELPKRVPKAALNYQPFPGGHSIGSLVLHMIEVEGWWIEEVAAGRKFNPGKLAKWGWEELDQYKVRWPEPPDWTYAQYLALQDKTRKQTLKTLRKLDPEAFVRRPREKAQFSVRWIVSHVIAHEAYHAGQAVLLYLQWQRRQK